MLEKNYDKIKKWFDDSIKLNLSIRKDNQDYCNKQKDWIGLLNYHKELATVKLCQGRQIGKTSYILDYLGKHEDAIVFVNSKQMLTVYKNVSDKVFLLDTYNPKGSLRGLDISKIKKVFLDDGSWFLDTDLIYKLLSEDDIERTFILLG